MRKRCHRFFNACFNGFASGFFEGIEGDLPECFAEDVLVGGLDYARRSFRWNVRFLRPGILLSFRGTISSIIMLLTRDFIILASIGFAVAVPLG